MEYFFLLADHQLSKLSGSKVKVLNILSFSTLAQDSLEDRIMPHATSPLCLDGSKLFSEVMRTSGYQERILGCLAVQEIHEIDFFCFVIAKVSISKTYCFPTTSEQKRRRKALLFGVITSQVSGTILTFFFYIHYFIMHSKTLHGRHQFPVLQGGPWQVGRTQDFLKIPLLNPGWNWYLNPGLSDSRAWSLPCHLCNTTLIWLKTDFPVTVVKEEMLLLPSGSNTWWLKA